MERTYKKRILLAAVGLSPQVVTESIYALYEAGGIDNVPTEVHVVSTTEGAERTALALLSQDPGWFHRLLKDYQLPPIKFADDHIHVICSESGEPLDDIRSLADNRAAADSIVRLVKQFTDDENAALHVSIAGGRKTMGFLLGYALTLYGRKQDRLSHVLVDQAFESAWEFFYPTPYSRTITVSGNRLVDTSKATVLLADIPVVSLRRNLPQHLINADTRYEDVVHAAREVLSAPSIKIDAKQRFIIASGVKLAIPSSQLALLAVFARRVLDAKVPISAPPKDAPDQDWARRYLRERRVIGPESQDLNRTEKAYANGMTGDDFSSILSKLKKTIRKGLGQHAEHYLIRDGAKRPRQYFLELPPDSIEFLD